MSNNTGSSKSRNTVPETGAIRRLLTEVETDAARDAVKTSDEVADMIIFHSRIHENSAEMSKLWEI